MQRGPGPSILATQAAVRSFLRSYHAGLGISHDMLAKVLAQLHSLSPFVLCCEDQ